jgi:hypothetical protein
LVLRIFGHVAHVYWLPDNVRCSRSCAVRSALMDPRIAIGAFVTAAITF